MLINEKIHFQKFAIAEILKSTQKDLKSININFDRFTYESEIVEKKNNR